MMILEDCEDERSSMSCNDACDEEEKLFTKKERIEIQKSMYEEGALDDEEIGGWLSNNEYVQHIINVIEKQIK